MLRVLNVKNVYQPCQTLSLEAKSSNIDTMKKRRLVHISPINRCTSSPVPYF